MRSSRLLISAAALSLVAACGGSAPSAPATAANPTQAITASPGATSPAVASPAPTAGRSSIDPAASALVAECGGPISPELSQAPEIEQQLPERLGGRPISRWSVRGRCALEMLVGGTGYSVDQLLADADSPGTPPVDPDSVAYAIGGRTDVQADPPYFVFATARPDDEDEIFLNLFVMLAGAGFSDVEGASRLVGFEVREIGGKEVNVGSADMLTQDDHQRGTPYLYQTDDTMFLVVTDDPAWAGEAFSKLP